jgi:hypothetical protein
MLIDAEVENDLWKTKENKLLKYSFSKVGYIPTGYTDL